eukprot:3633219-Prymnesium_polylepis.1
MAATRARVGTHRAARAREAARIGVAARRAALAVRATWRAVSSRFADIGSRGADAADKAGRAVALAVRRHLLPGVYPTKKTRRAEVGKLREYWCTRQNKHAEPDLGWRLIPAARLNHRGVRTLYAADGCGCGGIRDGVALGASCFALRLQMIIWTRIAEY